MMANNLPTTPYSPLGPSFAPSQIAQSRYQYTQIIMRIDGINVLASRDRVPHDQRPDDIVHVWKDGEWLDLLAYQYYGDPTLWWVIADFNELNEMRVVNTGQQLRLPSTQRLLLEILV